MRIWLNPEQLKARGMTAQDVMDALREQNVQVAAGYILYQTSEVLAHYDPRNHVAAALALFSSVALMFWYVIRIFMRARE